jgi:hypothetical protein
MWTRLCSSKLRLISRHVAQKQAVAMVNTEALKYTAQGVGAVLEVDHILPYTEPSDARLQPLLKTAKKKFQMVLEVDTVNTDAMLFHDLFVHTLGSFNRHYVIDFPEELQSLLGIILKLLLKDGSCP